MMNVFINNPHTRCSPGGVWGERTEYADIGRFLNRLYGETEKYGGVNCIMSNFVKIPEIGENDIFLSFHRNSNMKNRDASGAAVMVKSESGEAVQYKAYRLLEALCGEGGFRYKGVHTFTDLSPFKSVEKSTSPFTFLFTLGYIDNEGDNRVFDGFSSKHIKNFADKLNEIIKETENEVSSSFSKASFGGA